MIKKNLVFSRSSGKTVAQRRQLSWRKSRFQSLNRRASGARRTRTVSLRASLPAMTAAESYVATLPPHSLCFCCSLLRHLGISAPLWVGGGRLRSRRTVKKQRMASSRKQDSTGSCASRLFKIIATAVVCSLQNDVCHEIKGNLDKLKTYALW